MNSAKVVFNISDKGGRRSGIERRRFKYSGHFPERRSGKDRRNGLDRRSGEDRRVVHERREEVPVLDIGDRRTGMERRNGVDRRDFTIF